MRRPADDGVSMVEVLVGMGLFAVLSTVLLGMSLSTADVTQHTRRLSEVNEDSQLTMERVTRELRQASAVTSMHASTGPTDTTVLEFLVDFDGTQGAGAAQTVRYVWNPASAELTISEGGQTGTLASHVTSFVVTVGSTLWQYDADHDGETTWQELDAHGPPVGNANGTLDGGSAGELAHVDHVEVSMTVADAADQGAGTGTYRQTYVTKVDLRNVDPNP